MAINPSNRSVSMPQHPRTNRAGNLLHLPQSRCCSAPWKGLRTPSLHSSLLPRGSVLSLIIARYDRPPSSVRSLILTVLPANKRQQTNDRIVGTPGRSAYGDSLRAHFQGGYQGGNEEKGTGTVSPPSTRWKTEADARGAPGNLKISAKPWTQ